MVRNPSVEHSGELISLTVRQVACALHMNAATVYKGVADGTIPHVRVGNAIRIPVRAAGAEVSELSMETPIEKGTTSCAREAEAPCPCPSAA